MRSWRYAAVIKNGIVENWFEEPGLNNSSDDDDIIRYQPLNMYYRIH